MKDMDLISNIAIKLVIFVKMTIPNVFFIWTLKAIFLRVKE